LILRMRGDDPSRVPSPLRTAVAELAGVREV
jgi:hypothetical protein